MDTKKKDEGILLVVSGPSGAGKGTICSAIRSIYPNLHYSVSMTTREPRKGEVEGESYYSGPMSSLKNSSRKMLSWNMPGFMTITTARRKICPGFD